MNLGDIPLKKELKDKNPSKGDKSSKKTDKKPFTKKSEDNKVAVQLGNVDLLKIKFAELQLRNLEKILAQLVEMNYYLAKSVGEAKEVKKDG